MRILFYNTEAVQASIKLSRQYVRTQGEEPLQIQQEFTINMRRKEILPKEDLT